MESRRQYIEEKRRSAKPRWFGYADRDLCVNRPCAVFSVFSVNWTCDSFVPLPSNRTVLGLCRYIVSINHLNRKSAEDMWTYAFINWFCIYLFILIGVSCKCVAILELRKSPFAILWFKFRCTLQRILWWIY